MGAELTNPEDALLALIETLDERGCVNRGFGRLSFRDQDILFRRLRGEAFDSIAKVHGISYRRVTTIVLQSEHVLRGSMGDLAYYAICRMGRKPRLKQRSKTRLASPGPARTY